MLLPVFANAAGSISGNVTSIRVDVNGDAMVFFDARTTQTPPSCVGPSYVQAFAFTTTTSAGKAILAMMLTAKVTRAPVLAYGSGRCGVYGVVEDWSSGFINQ